MNTELLTNDQIQEKADELSRKLNVRIEPVVFIDPKTKEQIIGYLREPDFLAKLRILDDALKGGSVTAANACLEICIIKEESNPRITSESSENQQYNIGASMVALSLIEVAQNQFKKN